MWALDGFDVMAVCRRCTSLKQTYCAGSPRISMFDPNMLALIIFEISAFTRTDGYGLINIASDPDQEYIYKLATSPGNMLIKNTLWVGNVSFTALQTLYKGIKRSEMCWSRQYLLINLKKDLHTHAENA